MVIDKASRPSNLPLQLRAGLTLGKKERKRLGNNRPPGLGSMHISFSKPNLLGRSLSNWSAPPHNL